LQIIASTYKKKIKGYSDRKKQRGKEKKERYIKIKGYSTRKKTLGKREKG